MLFAIGGHFGDELAQFGVALLSKVADDPLERLDIDVGNSDSHMASM